MATCRHIYRFFLYVCCCGPDPDDYVPDDYHEPRYPDLRYSNLRGHPRRIPGIVNV